MFPTQEVVGLPSGFSYTPRGTKASRILARIGSRKFRFPALSEAQSVESIVQSRDGFLFQGFNGNPLRGRIIQNLIRSAGCTVFVETGSGKAATTLCVHSFLRLPVWSCEKNLLNYLICRCLTTGLDNVEIHHSDSPEFLIQSVDLLSKDPAHVPFFYLDAHGGFDGTGETGESCPVLAELEIIYRAPRFLAVIDDLYLPNFSGGAYGSTWLDLRLLAPTLLAQGTDHCWIPGYPPDTDIGWPSGYCVFWKGLDLGPELAAPTFPLNLLRKVDLTQFDEHAR